MNQAHNMQKRRLTRPAGPDQENKIATIERQIDIVQDLWALTVLHGDLFKLQHVGNDKDNCKRNDCEDCTLRHINPANAQLLGERCLADLP